MQIFSIHDSKAEAYLPPFYMRNKGEAIRAFQTTVNDTSTQFNKYPHDYTLVHLGEFDQDTAEMKTHAPQIIENAASLIN